MKSFTRFAMLITLETTVCEMKRVHKCSLGINPKLLNSSLCTYMRMCLYGGEHVDRGIYHLQRAVVLDGERFGIESDH